MYISEREAKELICEIGRKMYNRQFVAANDGNITIRIGDRTVIATPTGVSKGDLKPEMLLKVDFDGNVLEGTYKPTTELPMHLRVYKENDAIMSTAHAHPIFLNCLANLGVEVDMPLTPATTAISGRIPVLPYCNPGSTELADNVAPYTRDLSVVLLANHGPIAWGKSPIEAWHVLEEAEVYAKMAIIHKFIIKDYRPLTKTQIHELLITHGMTANPKKLVNAPDVSNNTDPATSLGSLEIRSVKIDEETIDKLADAIAKKLNR